MSNADVIPEEGGPHKHLRRTSSSVGQATPEAFAAKQREVWELTLSLVAALGRTGTVAKDGASPDLCPHAVPFSGLTTATYLPLQAASTC